MELILVVSSATFFSILKLNALRLMANSVEPTAPTAADSVGVAIPAKIEPRTTIINRNGKIVYFQSFSESD